MLYQMQHTGTLRRNQKIWKKKATSLRPEYWQELWKGYNHKKATKNWKNGGEAEGNEKWTVDGSTQNTLTEHNKLNNEQQMRRKCRKSIENFSLIWSDTGLKEDWMEPVRQ